MSFKFFRQLEEKDCGPTCLRMVCKFYGKDISIKYLRELCNMTRLGASMQDLKYAAKKIGYESLGLKLFINELTTLQLPVILYFKPAHYVVLYKVIKKKNQSYFCIADPGYNKVTIDESELSRRWLLSDGKGYLLMLEPSELFLQKTFEKAESQNSIKRMWDTYKHKISQHKTKISIALILAILAMVTSWTLPFFFQKIVDNGIVGKDINFVWWILILQFIMAFSNFLSSTFSSVLLMRTNFKISMQVFTEYLHKIIKLPISMFDRRQNSDFIVRIDDINRIQNFLTSQGIEFFLLITNFTVFSFLLIYFNYWIFIIVILLGLLGIVWATFFLKKRKYLDYKLTTLNAQNHLTTYEMITEMAEIKANNAQNNKINIWSEIYKEQAQTFLSTLYLNYWQVLGPQFFSRLENLFTTLVCAYFVISDKMSIGTMMSIGFITAQLSAPMDKFIYFMRGFQDLSLSNERVQEIHTIPDESLNRNQSPPQKLQNGISINNVSFKYIGSASSLVLSDVSLFIPKNKTTAIVGTSGSGKTTLLKLLLGFYSPIQGEILIDSLDLSSINLDLWRSNIGVVMQNGYIFSGTIIENIAIADEDPDVKKVSYAAKMAKLDDFIEGLPQKYKTKIGKSGIDISGGQKQRILIARAIYKDPEIILLDEATSALDANTESAIVDNLNNQFKGKTVIIIAHRFSTIKNADQIVVLEKGVIVEQGTHEKLSESNGSYFKLVKNQLNI